MMRALGMLFLLFPLVFSCGKKKSDDEQVQTKKEFKLTPEERKWWITKVVRKLRAGKGISSEAELEQWYAKTDDQIVDDLMADPLFYDAVLDFNLYYLGYKSDSLKFPDHREPLSFGYVVDVNPTIFEHAVAVDGALGLREGKDFFNMLSADIPEIIQPFGPIRSFGDDFDVITDRDAAMGIRSKTNEKMIKDADEFIAILKSERELKASEVCPFIYEKLNAQILNRVGIPFRKISKLFDNGDRYNFSKLCPYQPQNPPGPDSVVTVEERAKLLHYTENARSQLPIVGGDWNEYFPQHVVELQREAVAVSPVQSGQRFSEWGWLWRIMVNSSTNANRKRAAYALKRFFCDDLTPLNIVSSQEHNPENKHASDPSCQSCHYKLDPMAGFFRNIDGFGNEVIVPEGQKREMFFSDGARTDSHTYAAQWKGRDRSWNVGYIRSLQNQDLNDYGDHEEFPKFDDLFTIVKRSPEAKECLTRRVFEYFVGEQQNVDPGYLAGLTSQYNDTAKTEPAKAFKETIKAVVKSHTFQSQNAESTECYDFAVGVNPDERPPCRVAFILEKNCISCHKSSGAAGGLDLASWVAVEGSDKSFSHRDAGGNQKKKSETFQAMSERLQSTDPATRMPLNAAMSDQDRSALYLWLNQEISKK